MLWTSIIYLEVKTWLFDKRPRKFSPSSTSALCRCVALSIYGTRAEFTGRLVPRIVEIEHMRHVKNDL